MLNVRPTYGLVAALAVLWLAGCQSGVERDIVQRELRQQEDQIYAMEDYLAEYQQLLILRQVVFQRVDLIFLLTHFALHDVAFDAGLTAGRKCNGAQDGGANWQTNV